MTIHNAMQRNCYLRLKKYKKPTFGVDDRYHPNENPNGHFKFANKLRNNNCRYYLKLADILLKN